MDRIVADLTFDTETNGTPPSTGRYACWGMGSGAIGPVAVNEQGRILPAALAEQLGDASGPLIVCAQIGNVNTGEIDPVGEICEIAHRSGAWVHVDGAFGLWAAASPKSQHLTSGVELADSWATDAHKWLNVPYNSGLLFCTNPAAHRAGHLLARRHHLAWAGGDANRGVELVDR